jgi:hypothetical protein
VSSSRDCTTCRHRWRGHCAHEGLVGTGDDWIDGSPQTDRGERILDWLAEAKRAVRGRIVFVGGAGPCPGWERR